MLRNGSGRNSLTKVQTIATTVPPTRHKKPKMDCPDAGRALLASVYTQVVNLLEASRDNLLIVMPMAIMIIAHTRRWETKKAWVLSKKATMPIVMVAAAMPQSVNHHPQLFEQGPLTNPKPKGTLLRSKESGELPDDVSRPLPRASWGQVLWVLFPVVPVADINHV